MCGGGGARWVWGGVSAPGGVATLPEDRSAQFRGRDGAPDLLEAAAELAPREALALSHFTRLYAFACAVRVREAMADCVILNGEAESWVRRRAGRTEEIVLTTQVALNMHLLFAGRGTYLLAGGQREAARGKRGWKEGLLLGRVVRWRRARMRHRAAAAVLGHAKVAHRGSWRVCRSRYGQDERTMRGW